MERPLAERERINLLVIIAALCAEARIDVQKTSKAAQTIESAVSRLGAELSVRGISDHLRRIPEALERRAKDS